MRSKNIDAPHFSEISADYLFDFLRPNTYKLYERKSGSGGTGGGQLNCFGMSIGIAVFHIKFMGGCTVAEHCPYVCGMEHHVYIGGNHVFDTAVTGAYYVAAVDGIPKGNAV